MEFKVGDIVEDSRSSLSHYRYCQITRIEELLDLEESDGIAGSYKIWGYWATSLSNLKIKHFSNTQELWCRSDVLKLVEEKNKKVIKTYGIVQFMKNIERK